MTAILKTKMAALIKSHIIDTTDWNIYIKKYYSIKNMNVFKMH